MGGPRYERAVRNGKPARKRTQVVVGRIGPQSHGPLETELLGCFSDFGVRNEPASDLHTKNLSRERRLTSGSRPVGRSTAFRCVGGGGLSKRGKGGSGPSSPSSLPLFDIEVGEAYTSGGAGAGQPFPPTHHHFGCFDWLYSSGKFTVKYDHLYERRQSHHFKSTAGAILV